MQQSDEQVVSQTHRDPCAGIDATHKSEVF
jgi:hypothetical protein